MLDLNIFDLSEQDVLPKEQQKNNDLSDLFRPDPKESKSGVYSAIIKFLPNPEDPLGKSIINKWTIWLTNPLSGDSMQVDCPSTIGERSLLQDTYFKLKKSNSAIDQENAKIFSRKRAFFSYIQIIEDEQHPELVGQVKIFRYGIQLFNKIKEEMNPTDSYAQKNNPFDIFKGKPLRLKVKTKAGFNNYDDSAFASISESVIVNGKRMAKTQEDMDIIKDFLTKLPDIVKYEFKAWDEKTNNFVNDCVNSVLGNKSVLSNVTDKTKLVDTYTPKSKPTSSKVVISSEEEDDFDLDAILSDVHAS